MGPKRNLDHRSFFSLDRFVSESKLFLFSKEVDSKLGVRLLLVLYCVVVIKHVAFFYYLGEINSDMQIVNKTHSQRPDFFFKSTKLAPVVQRLDKAIYRINHYPADSVVCFVNTYPLDSDLSGG